jgi:hypothetical protein
VDRYKQKPTIIILMVTSASLTLLAFLWLVLPPSITHTPIPSIALFGFGQNFAPRMSNRHLIASRDFDVLAVMLVVIVPKIVSLKYVSTALGVHKSVSVLYISGDQRRIKLNCSQIIARANR